jgi:hypothetical protein
LKYSGESTRSDLFVRLLVLKIFQTLVDRKGNLEKLSQPTVEPATDLINQKANANKQVQHSAVLGIRILRIPMFLDHLNPDLGPLIRGIRIRILPSPSKKSTKNLVFYYLVTC